MTLYTSKRGKIVWFPQSPPQQPPSWRQLHYRNNFRKVASYWRLLSDDERAAWDAATKRASLGCNGHALYTYRALRHDQAAIDTISRTTSTPLVYNGP